MSDFDSYRSIVEHEDGLVNNRTAWNLTLNGLLFTSLAIFLTDNADSNIAKLIALAGIFCNFFTLLSVNAAFRAIRETAQKFHENDEKNKRSIVGSLNTHFFGMIASISIPISLSVIWNILFHYTENKNNIDDFTRISSIFSSFYVLTSLIYCFLPLLSGESTGKIYNFLSYAIWKRLSIFIYLLFVAIYISYIIYLIFEFG